MAKSDDFFAIFEPIKNYPLLFLVLVVIGITIVISSAVDNDQHKKVVDMRSECYWTSSTFLHVKGDQVSVDPDARLYQWSTEWDDDYDVVRIYADENGRLTVTYKRLGLDKHPTTINRGGIR